MRARITLLAGLLALSTVAADQRAEVAVDHSVELQVGESATVEGGIGVGTNVRYFAADEAQCSSAPDSYCETVLVHLVNPYDEDLAKRGRERANVQFDLLPGPYPAEMDLVVYESDADGTQGAQVGQSATFAIVDCPTACESVTAVVTSTPEVEEQWMLVHVIYWAAAGDYQLDVAFTQ